MAKGTAGCRARCRIYIVGEQKEKAEATLEQNVSEKLLLISNSEIQKEMNFFFRRFFALNVSVYAYRAKKTASSSKCDSPFCRFYTGIAAPFAAA